MAIVNEEQDFEELMERVKSDRCQKSFQAIFDSFYGHVLAYLQKSGMDKERASELAQDAFVTVWKRSDLFDSSKGKFKVWLFTIVRNLRFDHFRSKTRDVLSLSSSDIYELDEAIPSQDFIFTSDFVGSSREIRARVQTLPQDQKQVIEAIYFGGYSQSEYAELKKIPIGTVKSRIRLALTHLRKGMEEQ